MTKIVIVGAALALATSVLAGCTKSSEQLGEESSGSSTPAASPSVTTPSTSDSSTPATPAPSATPGSNEQSPSKD